jgi:hypothetical protein
MLEPFFISLNDSVVMTKIYSYILRYDDGAAPNPFWSICTLAICKPVIRRTAETGDWVIGTGSKNARCNDGVFHDLSDDLVYAMKVTKVLSLAEYDRYCQVHLPHKIPTRASNDWRIRMGDCIYAYGASEQPTIRPGVHGEGNRQRDLGGINVLLSDHFYYFGEAAVPLPTALLPLRQPTQGHRIIENAALVEKFEAWLQDFELNTLSGEPQLKHLFDRPHPKDTFSACAVCHLEEDAAEEVEVVC